MPTDLSSGQLNDDKKTKLVELYDEEAWNLNEVVLVEDSKSTVLGKAIKVDNDYILVKMQSKSTDLNPPMKLVCGHVISKDALNKLNSTGK